VRRFVPLIFLTFALLALGTVVWFPHAHGARITPVRADLSESSVLRPPTLKEDFTLLPCTHSSTIGLEGCDEHRVLTLDASIDARRRGVFVLLFDVAAKRRFIAAETAWFSFRKALCASEADVNEGGSLAPLDFALCLVHLDQQHEAELVSLRSRYQNH
jgi:uncharacterized protein YecT (DUF1311 family)